MSLKGKLLLDSSDYNKKMDQAKAKASITGQQIRERMEKAGQGFEAINKLGGATGGVMKNIQQAIAGMMSPIGMVMAGIAALGTLAIKWWDKMNESLQEYKERIKVLLGIMQKEQKEQEQLAKTQKDYISILQKLASKESLTNAEKLIAIKIIQQLTKRYGDLGLSIDQATGYLIGFERAQKKIKTEQRNEQLSGLEKTIKLLDQQAKKQAQLMTKSYGHDWNILGSQTFKYDTNKYKDMQEAIAAGYNVQFNPTHDINYIPGSNGSKPIFRKVEISDEQKRLRKLWNEGGLEGKRAFANEMITRSAGDDDQIALYKQLYDNLDALIKKQKQYNNIKDYGTNDLAILIQQSANIAQSMAKDNAQTEKLIETQKAIREKRERDSAYKSLDSDDERVEFLEKQLNEEKKIGNELEKQSNQLREKQKAIQEQIKAVQMAILILEKETAKTEKQQEQLSSKRFELEKQSLQLLRLNKQINQQINDITSQTQSNLTKQLQTELSIKEIKEKSQDFYDSSLQALDAEIQITKLKLQGLDEEAEKQKLINELKLKGLNVDEMQVDEILAKRKELQKLNTELQNQKKDVKTAEAKEIKAKTDLSGLDTFSNELATRGGFTSSVITATTKDVNERIYQTQKSSENQLKMILSEMKKIGVIN